MVDKSPTVDEWRKLYDLAMELKKLAPWQWMSELEIFGVKNPENGEISFVNVSGMESENKGFRFVRGADGLFSLIEYLESVHLGSPENIVQLSHIILAYTHRRNLAPQEHKMLQDIQFKRPGRRSGTYPVFRSYAPGLLPWLINRDEARMLLYVLEQALEVAKRCKMNEDLLMPEEIEDGRVFVRVPVSENGILRWDDQFLQLEMPDKLFVPPSIDDRSLMVLHQLPRRPQTLDIDAVMTPLPMVPEEDPDGRPYFPYILLVMDSKANTIYTTEILRPVPTIEAMWRGLPQILINIFARIGFIPAEVRVATEDFCEVVKTISYRLKFTIRQGDWTPEFAGAIQSMIGSLMENDDEFDFEDEDDDE